MSMTFENIGTVGELRKALEFYKDSQRVRINGNKIRVELFGAGTQDALKDVKLSESPSK